MGKKNKGKKSGAEGVPGKLEAGTFLEVEVDEEGNATAHTSFFGSTSAEKKPSTELKKGIKLSKKNGAKLNEVIEAEKPKENTSWGAWVVSFWSRKEDSEQNPLEKPLLTSSPMKKVS